MTNRHREKYLIRLLAGLGLISGGILVIIYTSFLKNRQQEWYIWGAIAIIVVNSGLVLLGSAFVHKVKADLIRKQKQKDQTKKYEFE
jgi:peptidoglycan/LPS O-acetylase OafA/YrhL